ncbi:MAG: hypothetical protein AABX19_03615 [Nanoarchaeota archaeon]
MKTILIGEDELRLNRFYQSAYGSRYNLVIRRDGNEVLAELEKDDYDFVILDNDLRDGPTGIEIIERMHKIGKTNEMKFALCTCNPDPTLETRAEENGVAYFSKCEIIKKPRILTEYFEQQ